MLAAVEEIYPAQNLHLDFWKKEASQQLNALLRSHELPCMLEGMDYCRLEMVGIATGLVLFRKGDDLELGKISEQEDYSKVNERLKFHTVVCSLRNFILYGMVRN